MDKDITKAFIAIIKSILFIFNRRLKSSNFNSLSNSFMHAFNNNNNKIYLWDSREKKSVQTKIKCHKNRFYFFWFYRIYSSKKKKLIASKKKHDIIFLTIFNFFFVRKIFFRHNKWRRMEICIEFGICKNSTWTKYAVLWRPSICYKSK